MNNIVHIRKRKRFKARYVYLMNMLSVLGGARRISNIKQDLNKLEGVRVWSSQSPYIGRSSVYIETRTKKDMEKALKKLKEYGYISKVKDEMKEVHKYGTPF